MNKKPTPQKPRDYEMLERQRKALRTRLFRMIDELEGRPVDHRKYQPFPIGALEKAIEQSLQQVENLTRRLIVAVEKQLPKPWDKK